MMKKSILLVFLFCFALTGIAGAFDRAFLKAEARRRSRDPDALRWSENTLNDRFEMAQLEVCRRTNCLRARSYITTKSTTTEYNLPSDFYAMVEASIYFSTTNGLARYEKLIYKDREVVFADDGRWESQSGSIPENYYIRETSWNVTIGITPPPNNTYSGGNYLRVDYVMKNSTMTSDASEPFNGAQHLQPYFYVLIDYVLMLARLDQEREAEAQALFQKFEFGCARMAAEINAMPDFQGHIIAVEYGGKRND